MMTGRLRKYGGVSLILGAFLLAAYSFFFATLLPYDQMRQDITLGTLNPNWVWITAVAFFGIVLMMFGFTAVYSKINESAGLAGFLGYVFLETAYLLQACAVTWEICIYPLLSSYDGSLPLMRDMILENSPLVKLFGLSASLTLFIGILLFCFALVRSKEFPKIAGILVFAGAMIYGLGSMLHVLVGVSGIIILAAGCLILGLKMMGPGPRTASINN